MPRPRLNEALSFRTTYRQTRLSHFVAKQFVGQLDLRQAFKLDLRPNADVYLKEIAATKKKWLA